MFRKNAFSTILAVGALLAITLGLLIISKPVEAQGDKIEICHLPPGNPDNYHTIDIGMKAWGAHEKHGDLTGACNGLCNINCDDGDACTVDDYEVSCEDEICPVDRDPVDCNDSDPLTVDSCDSSNGCEYECIDGYVMVEGVCVEDNPEPVDCPCNLQAALTAEYNAYIEGGVLNPFAVSCPGTDINPVPAFVAVEFLLSGACSGAGCNGNFNQQISGCGTPDGSYIQFGLEDEDPTAQHEACVTEIELFCGNPAGD